MIDTDSIDIYGWNDSEEAWAIMEKFQDRINELESAISTVIQIGEVMGWERTISFLESRIPADIRALTVQRQWADKIASGEKQFEIRNFQTDYRGPVVVTVSKEKIALCMVDLVDIVPSDTVADLSPNELAFGKWAWQLLNPRRIKTVSVKGRLGLWKWEYGTPELMGA